MRGRIYYWAEHMEYPKLSEIPESSIAGLLQDREDLNLPFYQDCMWFFLQEDYYAVYFQNGWGYRAWYGSAKAAYDFLMDGERRSKLSAHGIELPTGEYLKAPYYGGDRDRWEALGA